MVYNHLVTKVKKLICIISISLASAISLAVAVPFIIYGARSAGIKKDYQYLKTNSVYNSKVEIANVELVTQHISCGYAVIEMMSSYYGSKVSEDDLSAKNKGKITTSSSNGFLKELKKSVPSQSFVKHSYLNNDVLLKEIYVSLMQGNPVALEWAAQYEGSWTLHFSLISGIDIGNDNITIYNPYGLVENITIDEFINRSSFKAYKKMPLFLSFGFAYGAFEKNTIFFAR